MSKPQDGFVSRFFNRPISRRITSVLLKFPIHPSTWTISICVLPLIASVFLVRGDYASIVIGAAIFQVFSILDGCDGEIARAKNLESKLGERLDYFCDFIASVLYVLTLGLGLHRSSEGIVCAALITANEVLLRAGKSQTAVAPSALQESFYARRRYHDRAFRLTESWRTICVVALSANQTRYGNLRFSFACITGSGPVDPSPLGDCCRCEPGSQRVGCD